jgi:hypothetical protein
MVLKLFSFGDGALKLCNIIAGTPFFLHHDGYSSTNVVKPGTLRIVQSEAKMYRSH